MQALRDKNWKLLALVNETTRDLSAQYEKEWKQWEKDRDEWNKQLDEYNRVTLEINWGEFFLEAIVLTALCCIALLVAPRKASPN